MSFARFLADVSDRGSGTTVETCGCMCGRCKSTSLVGFAVEREIGTQERRLGERRRLKEREREREDSFWCLWGSSNDECYGLWFRN